MPTKLTGSLMSLIRSKKTAVFLIIFITIASTLGMLIPQSTPTPDKYNAWAANYPLIAPLLETLDLNNVYFSWWFLLLNSLFLLNLSTCTWDQALKAWRLWQRRSTELPSARHSLNIDSTKLSRANLENGLSRKGFKIIQNNQESTIFEKNPLAIWASLIVHLGLIIIVLGGLISVGFKMTGYLMVMEGEIRQELAEEYEVLNEAPFYNLIGHLGYGIGLDKQQRILKSSGKLDYIQSTLTIYEGNKTIYQQTIENGKPLIYNGLGLYYYNAGFVPLVTITNAEGRTIYQGFLFMETVKNPSGTIYQRKNFKIPETTLTLNLQFFPNLVRQANQISNGKDALGNAGIKVSVDNDGQQIGQGVLTQGTKLEFAGNSLTFGEVRSWTGLEIIYDPGANVLFAGFWMTALGTALLYLCSYHKLQISYRNETIDITPETEFRPSISYYSSKYSNIFQAEIKELLVKLAEESSNDIT